ncbi:hypothetical protein Y032_0009g656 [Ancylostoma ceylanicum]|uniref:Uncharacterized protein n=1 Tax=Ancylostoma ceylanicum TaxID=53326 RepID=A0A016VJ54_9BILA|nr:hypothetical protein Y032_0009g656 [Ancylostoma ceylanicum]
MLVTNVFQITQRVDTIKKDTKNEFRQQYEQEDMEVAYKDCGEGGPARAEARKEPDPEEEGDILRTASESAFAGLGRTTSGSNDSRSGIKVHGVPTVRYLH